ncbi:hypothetical protein M1316_00470 [Candidatus Parvarchaeota archaeon]|nr:hypothetical protein [Candidatus Parvarchaeota archaeon]
MAKKMVSEGKTIRQVANELGFPYFTVCKWVRGYCVKRGYSQEIKAEAKKLVEAGLTKGEVAYKLKVSLGTIQAWGIPSPNPPKVYTEETRRRAEELVLSGLSLSETAKQIGASLKTVRGWVGSVKITTHPRSLLIKARQLAGRGLDKAYLSRRYGLSSQTVARWTNDVVNKKSRVLGRYFMVLTELVNKGYFITNRKDASPAKFLCRYVNLKSILVGRFAICYFKGSEKSAFNALIKRAEMQSLTKRKINILIKEFKIKD